MSAEAPQIAQVIAGETRNAKVSFANLLETGELLSGTPTVTELTSSDLTIATVARSTETLTINGESVAASEAVTFRVSGFSANKQYRLRVQCSTDASQVLRGIVRFLAESGS